MDTQGHATPDRGRKRDKKRDKTENRPRIGLEQVLNGKVVGHNLDGTCGYGFDDRSSGLSASFSSSGRLLGLITMGARSASTIYERLMRAQGGLLTWPSTDSVAEREQFSLTVIPVTFSVVRSGLEELGRTIQVMAETSKKSREICDVLEDIDRMLRAMLQSAFTVGQRFMKVAGLRTKQIKHLEKLVEEECDRTFGALSEVVLLRLVRIIGPLMERMFEDPEQTTDAAMVLIGVIEGALESVERSGFNGGAVGVKERVALGVCQELRGLSRRIPVDGGRKSDEERKQRLAKKEAVWYLGAVLQRSVGDRLSARMANRVVGSAGLGIPGRLSTVESEFVFGSCRGIAEK